MSVIVIPGGKRTRQPSGPERIDARWRSRVISAWYPLARMDVVRQVPLTLHGTASLQADKLLFPVGDTTSYADLGTLASLPDVTKLSVVVIATPSNLGNRLSLFDTGNNGTTHGFVLASGYSTTSAQFIYNAADYVVELGSGTLVAGERAVHGLSYNKANGTSGFQFYKNGRQYAFAGMDGGNKDLVYGGGLFCVGGREATTGGTVLPFIGTIELLALINGEVSAAEFRELSNPWQLFAPSRRVVVFGAAAGGPTAYPLTASPATATLTGTDATFVYTPASTAYPLTASAGTATFAGSAATFSWGRAVNAAAGTAALAGTAATFSKGYQVTASAGTLTATGTAATFEFTGLVQYALTAEPAVVTVAGTSATFAYTGALVYTLTASPGSMTLTGRAATVGIPSASIWTDVGVSAATWSDVGPATSIWTDI
jgi:hypothetical protein